MEPGGSSLASHEAWPAMVGGSNPGLTGGGAASLAAFGQSRFTPPQYRGRARGYSQPTRGGFPQQNRGGFSQTRRPFCKTCYDANRGKDTYLTHTTTHPSCPSRQQFSSLEAYPQEVLEAGDHIIPGNEIDTNQVCTDYQHNTITNNAGLAHIEPVPAQILSLTDDNNKPIHIELDNGATCSYIIRQEAIDRGYNIYPNTQASQLGDGITMIESCGEIDVCLYRKDHKLRFRAIVAQNLHCPVIGGTTFIKDNNIKQDFVHNQISLLGNKCTVPSTQREALLPIAQHIGTNHNTIYTHKHHTHHLHSTSTNNTPGGSSLASHEAWPAMVGGSSSLASCGAWPTVVGGSNPGPTATTNNTPTQPLGKNTNSLVSIKSKRIILPGDHLTVKTELPDQEMVVEAVKTYN